jgi:hypothetical protein
MYIAELLSNLGCDCGHEDYFPKEISPTAYRLARAGLRRLKWRRPPYGEAAWEAAPYLHLLPDETVVFHQIRHPLEFVRSRQRKGLSRAAFRDRHMSIEAGASNKHRFWEFPLEEQVRYFTEFWIEWNALVETNAQNMEYYRYRIDDLSAEHVIWMLERIGWKADPDHVRSAHGRMSQRVNKGKTPNEEVSFDLLPPALRARLKHTCERYGFDL